MKKICITLSTLLFCTAAQAMDDQEKLRKEKQDLNKEIIALLTQDKTISNNILDHEEAASRKKKSVAQLEQYLAIQKSNQKIYNNSLACLNHCKKIQKIDATIDPEKQDPQARDALLAEHTQHILFTKQDLIFGQLRIDTVYPEVIRKTLKALRDINHTLSAEQLTYMIEQLKQDQLSQPEAASNEDVTNIIHKLTSDIELLQGDCETYLANIQSAEHISEEIANTTGKIDIKSTLQDRNMLANAYRNSISELKGYLGTYLH